MKNEELNNLAFKIHSINKKNGFFDNPINKEILLVLIISELSEAIEADRKNQYFNIEKHRLISEAYKNNFKYIFEQSVKDTFEDELADVIMRILDLMEYSGYKCHVIPIQRAFTDDLGSDFLRLITKVTNILPGFVGTPTDQAINYLLSNILKYAKFKNIDIWRFVEMKVRYNELRDYKHGKKY